ncbi:MAG: ABC transporter ATP-binding protein [Lachnospiraceae bacterium]|nr:ABC transporter ATP-binding protein [Lachnospiraceae bacterium]
MDKDNILEVKDLRVNIHMMEGELTAVRGVNFEIKKGETLGLVGESGCGKSLTCKAILAINDKKCEAKGSIKFNSDESGEVEILDLNPKGEEIRSIRGKQISMIFQEPMVAFSPMYTIGNQINECTRLHITKDKKKSKEISMAVMKKVGIANVEKRYNQYPHEFSGGMLQRALIAMALVCNPKMLIADEPTTALDVTIQAQILELMKSLQKDFNTAILFITHDLGVVAKMCDRVAVMYLGKIVESADTETIYANPQHPYTKGLIGSVHKIGGNREDRLFSIEGTVPLAMNLPVQCGFYDRCTVAIDGLCNKAEPELVEIEPGHKVACFACNHEGCKAECERARKEIAEREERERKEAELAAQEAALGKNKKKLFGRRA